MFSKSSIIFKTSLVIGLVITLLLALLGYFFISSENRVVSELKKSSESLAGELVEERMASELNSMEKHIGFIAKTVANVSGSYVYNFDTEGLKKQLGGFLDIDSIKLIAVVDSLSGSTFLSAYKKGGETIYEEKMPDVGEGFKSISQNSLYEGGEVGKVIIYYSDKELIEAIEKSKESVLQEFKKQTDAIDDELAATTLLQIVMMCGTVVLLVVIIIFMLARLVKKPIDVLKSAVENMKKQDDTRVDYIDAKSDDEIGELTKYLNQYITKIVYNSEIDDSLINEAIKVVESVKQGYLSNNMKLDEENSGALNRLQKVVYDMLKVLDDQTRKILITLDDYKKDDYRTRVERGRIEGSIGDLIDGVNALGDALCSTFAGNLQKGNMLKESANTLSESIKELEYNFQRQKNIIIETSSGLNEMLEDLHGNNRKVEAMTTHAQDVKAIVDIISKIAEQTNLLALNAAIEAARAGEQGRGFAVVSDEVRKLAEQTQKSLSEINVSINGLIQSVIEVAHSFSEQSKGIEEVSVSIKNIENVTLKSADRATDVGRISSSLLGLANELVEESGSKKI